MAQIKCGSGEWEVATVKHTLREAGVQTPLSVVRRVHEPFPRRQCSKLLRVWHYRSVSAGNTVIVTSLVVKRGAQHHVILLLL